MAEIDRSSIDGRPLVVLHHFGKPHDGLDTEKAVKTAHAVIGAATESNMCEAAAKKATYTGRPDLFQDYLDAIRAIHKENAPAQNPQ